jgi:hypothetical protein
MSYFSFLKSTIYNHRLLAGIAMALTLSDMSALRAADSLVGTFVWNRELSAPTSDGVYEVDDTLSAQFSPQTTVVSGVSATLSGRNYGILSDDSLSRPSFRWGLLGTYDDAGRLQSGWTVSFGFDPDDHGVTTHTAANGGIWDASYLSFNLQPSATQSLAAQSLTITAPTFLLVDDKAWAAVSTDGFKHFAAVRENFDSLTGNSTITIPLNGLKGNMGEPLEVRVYGILGEDEGTFQSASLNAQVFGVAPIPEPSAALLALGAVSLTLRRRRDYR